ncbi:MAG: AAA family ATPase [Planctomycetaceae bacterium]
MSATVRPLSPAGLRTSHKTLVPFAEDPTTDMYFPSESHEEALARMLFLTEEQERCGLLVGPAGAGKSMLMARLHHQLRRSGRKSCRIDLAGLDHTSLLHRLAVELGVNPLPNTDPHELWDQIEQIISSAARVQQPWILLFDHANRLRPGALSLLEQLLYSPHSRGIVMLFSSRPEEQTTLLKTLSEHSSLRIELSVLTPDETQSYVEFALDRGMISTPEFTRDAVQLIARISGGLPRQINRLCRALLLAAQADLRTEIDSELVLSVTEELLGMRVSA